MSAPLNNPVILDLSVTQGSMLIGGFGALVLWGANGVQLFFYLCAYSSDPLSQKLYGWFALQVIGVWLVDTANNIVLLQGVWNPLVSHWGDLNIVGSLIPGEMNHVITNAIVSYLVQLFFIRRIYNLGGQRWLAPVVLSIFALAALVLIMTPSTRQMILRLLIVTINTNAWTALASLIALLMMVGSRTTFLYCIPQMTISGLYVGSLLANLNARAYVKDGHVTWNEFTSVFPDDSNVPLGAIGAQQTSGGRTYTADIESARAHQIAINIETSRITRSAGGSQGTLEDDRLLGFLVIFFTRMSRPQTVCTPLPPALHRPANEPLPPSDTPPQQPSTPRLFVPKPPDPYVQFVLVPTSCLPDITQPVKLEIRHAILCWHVTIECFRYLAWCVLKLEGSYWIGRGSSITDRSDDHYEDNDPLVEDVYYQFKPDTSCEWDFAHAAIKL
ncbi:uncharacterized protein STEHIDRAFT_161161 [Stereum hirsutum FP-91666 SS1]|uniref:uncharacterized protein n=1 Tax=Stereum hirsutum (strain FP-91666) TaxID=721885 RepID=UPI0004449D43|nr:uncharacterized protein STEHIDRAFT_161161 [Stereum hirsutum FP-91666 SS1]EIM81802.1 hypothetical protein STEHIDRAFT_161161 [Stereum hirsutum FP-91666 SS1]